MALKRDGHYHARPFAFVGHAKPINDWIAELQQITHQEYRMKQALIIYPVFAVVLLTFIIGIWMLRLRIKAVKEEGLNPAYFLLNRGAKLPDGLAKVTQHYDNLFEMPVLFYVASLSILVTSNTDTVFIGLAWLFVGARYIHAFIHTTYNGLKHRRLAFLAGTSVIAVMWLKLLVQLLGS